MKRFVLLMGITAAVSQTGWCSSLCIPGTLSTYIALGTGGCMIGTDTVNMFQVISGQQFPVVPITPGNVTVTPSGVSTSPTLTFGLSINTAATFEAIFTYRISGNSFTGSNVTASNITSSGDGSVTDIQNLCGGGIFGSDGVSNCTKTTLGPVITFGADAEQTSFSGVPFLTVTDDITVDGGLSGTAGAGKFADQFTAQIVSAVPEPGTMFVTVFGAAFLLVVQLRSRRNREIV